MKEIVKKMLSLKVSSTSNVETSDKEKQISKRISTTTGNTSPATNDQLVPDMNAIQDTLLELSTSVVKSNITITDSSNVHLGNKINYDGNLYLNLLKQNNETGISLIQHDNNNGVLIKTTSNVHISDYPIIPRSFWSIRKPREKYDKIKEPVGLVVISHTATTSSTNQSKNIQLIRDIQAFHVDTHNWNDIGYNFLIGCDGTIYEGRGWGIEGAHTFGYNNRSMGITFIGCFINKKPTDHALYACQNLLERGISEGHLAKNYKLLGHRQCSETESPGTKLFEEITTWDHFYNKTIDEDIYSMASTEILPACETLDDAESLASSIVESSIVDSASEADGENSQDDDDSRSYTNISELPIYNQLLNTNSLRKQLEHITPLATYNNVNVANSSNVVFGNVIKVKGVLNINVYNKDKNNRNYNENQEENIDRLHKRRESSPQANKESLNENSSLCRIIPRNYWSTLEPSEEFEYIDGPVDIVIISHTATNSSLSSQENTQLLRNIQTFHVDVQGWDDIGYNFLIGCDGNIYEGRGWNVVGVHTYGYNRRSLGIGFIGTFSRSLPPEKAIEACKNLLKRGIEEGHLKKDYKLLGHRQCIATVSPGRLLYEEITKWENFYPKDIHDDLKC
ncbi:uncharacterized protein LOC111675638 [Lucilia cuprina]|uniref:uncharacterized protein LOC111675638 n=1 Tax=Lucilia cuprina TaxID=7375 RepID=UPI001F06F616|nr:uncharacterized protein LOC111675638 [Lucilia cuprina]